MTAEVEKIYGHRVRVRCCGLCWNDGKLLLVNHAGITDGHFWAPPGGGIEFGESAGEALIREFREETGLAITPGRFLFAFEVINPPLHAIELFFEVIAGSEKPQTGQDPELPLIREVRYMSPGEIQSIDPRHRHALFTRATEQAEISRISGFFRI